MKPAPNTRSPERFWKSLPATAGRGRWPLRLTRRSSWRSRPASLRWQMPEIMENADEKLSTAMSRLLDFLWQEWEGLQVQIESLNTDLEQIARATRVVFD